LVAVVVALTVLQPQSWWNHGFLEDLDEWFGQAFAAFVMALALQQFSRSRPILVPFAVAAVLGIGVQWLLASMPQSYGSLVTGDLFLGVCFLWLGALLVRDGRRWWRRRRQEPREA